MTVAGWKETERVPAELLVLTLLQEEDKTKAALYREIAQRSDYRVDLSRARLSTALRRLEEKGYVLCLQPPRETGKAAPRRTYRVTEAGRIAQDVAYEEYYSTVQGMGLLLDFAGFEERLGQEEEDGRPAF